MFGLCGYRELLHVHLCQSLSNAMTVIQLDDHVSFSVYNMTPTANLNFETTLRMYRFTEPLAI